LKNTTQARFVGASCAVATMQCIPVWCCAAIIATSIDALPAVTASIPDGTVLPAVFTSVALGVRGFTRNLQVHPDGSA
jgi:hypothetical protein